MSIHRLQIPVRPARSPRVPWLVGVVLIWFSAAGASCERASGGESNSSGASVAVPTESGGSEESGRRTVADGTVESREPLAKHAWNHRPVVIFAPSRDTSEYRRQSEIFEAHRSGLRDRDIVLYNVFETDPSVGPDGRISSAAARALRERFDPASPFVVILVGKDTTEKLRRDRRVTAEVLFETIDAMPMRRREMRRQR